MIAIIRRSYYIGSSPGSLGTGKTRNVDVEVDALVEEADGSPQLAEDRAENRPERRLN